MTALVVSDLHLGARLERDVLRRPPALEALLDALDDVDRLVLLGDVVELLEQRPRRAMDDAEPVLRAIGARLGVGREAVVVPGNHDAALVRDHFRAHGVPAAVDAALPPDATPGLARLTSWLAPAAVEVRYPGVWLRDGVWATHGHYLDRHLMPESAYGVARGLLGRLPHDGAHPVDYEAAGGPSLTRLEALTRVLPRPLAAALDDAAEVVRAATMPARAPRMTLGLAPVTARLLGVQMRRASIPALARVVHGLGVDADCVLFGHVHRTGPLAGDVANQWRGPVGRPRILNTGCWVWEPVLLHRASPPHPYWPGGAVVIDDDAQPRAVGLLDHLGADVLRNERHRRLLRGSRKDPVRSEEERRMHGTFDTADGRPALRFERRLAHPVDAVWRAVTEPSELAHWFPATVDVDPRVGGRLTFAFPDGEPPAEGRVTELDPPHRFAFSWGDELLRFELELADGGRACVLRFTHMLDARDRAARDAAGWHVSLDGLGARLAGEPAQPPGTTPTDAWRARYEEYQRRGLPAGAPIPEPARAD